MPALKPTSVAGGVAAMSIAAMLARLAGLGTQWTLGFFFSHDDFIQLSFILAIQTLIAGLKDGGTGKYLVQTGNYDGMAYPAMRFTLGVNAFAIILALGIAPYIAKNIEGSEIVSLLLPIFLTIPLQSIASIHQARLRINREFRKIAYIETLSSTIQAVSTVIMAVLSMGVYSIVYGTIAGSVSQFIFYRVSSGGITRATSATANDFKNLFQSCKWIMLSSGAIALALRGDILIVGLSEDTARIAFYTFGTQLVFSTLSLFGSSLQTVILPTFSRLNGNTPELSSKFNEVGTTMARFSIPMLSLAAAFCPTAVHILWNGKWDNAAIVIQFFLLAYCFKMPAAVSGVLMEATGNWQSRFSTLMVESLIMALSAIALINNTISFTAAVAIAATGRAASGIIQILWAASVTTISARHLLISIAAESGSYLLIALSSIVLSQATSTNNLLYTSVVPSIAIAVIFALKNKPSAHRSIFAQKATALI